MKNCSYAVVSDTPSIQTRPQGFCLRNGEKVGYDIIGSSRVRNVCSIVVTVRDFFAGEVNSLANFSSEQGCRQIVLLLSH